MKRIKPSRIFSPVSTIASRKERAGWGGTRTHNQRLEKELLPLTPLLQLPHAAYFVSLERYILRAVDGFREMFYPIPKIGSSGVEPGFSAPFGGAANEPEFGKSEEITSSGFVHRVVT